MFVCVFIIIIFGVGGGWMKEVEVMFSKACEEGGWDRDACQ